MRIEPGDKYWTLPTPMNGKNDIPPDKACWIAHVDATAISVLIPLASKDIQVKVPRPLFGVNFRADPASPNAPAYRAAAHFPREYR